MYAVDEVKVVIWLGPVRIMVCLCFLLVFSGGSARLQLYLNVCFVVLPAKLARSKDGCDGEGFSNDTYFFDNCII